MDESLGYILVVLIWAVIWGCITKKINQDKGYEGGFAWGFWLGLIGLIVVLCKSDNRSSDDSKYSEEPKKISDADEILKFKKLLDEEAITQEEYDIKKMQILGL